jgi:hypothetical protein
MAAEKNETSPIEEKPPIFKNWKRVYAFVLAVFVVLVILFYAFTVTFS